MVNYSDSEIVYALQKNSKEAFEELYSRYFTSLNRYAFHMVMSNESCDITHDIFTKIWENRKDLNKEVNIKSYLYKAVKNSCLNHLKHLGIRDDNKNKMAEALLFADNDWDEEDNELIELMKKTIEKLPLHQKAILKLRTEGYTYKEIADKFQISTKTVDSHIARAYITIRRSLLIIKILIGF